MTEVRFAAILELKVAGLVEALMDASGLGLDDALLRVFRSQVYRDLEREETKLWHHSPRLLLDCLQKEMETGTPEYPDE